MLDVVLSLGAGYFQGFPTETAQANAILPGTIMIQSWSAKKEHIANLEQIEYNIPAAEELGQRFICLSASESPS